MSARTAPETSASVAATAPEWAPAQAMGPAAGGVAATRASVETGLGRRILAFGLLVVALLWAGIAFDLVKERERALADAEADTANLARAFEEHIIRTVAGLDQTMLYLKSEYERDPAGFDLDRSLANNVIFKRVSVQVGIIGPDGVLIATNVEGQPRVNLSDREHFRVHAGADTGELFISRPVMGRASGRWSIQLTRRLNAPDGRLAGVMVVSLDPHYLAEFYSSIDVGGSGLVMLAGSDGVVRAVSTAQVDLIGRSLPEGVLAQRMAAGHGSLHLPGPFDGEARVISYRALTNLPLVVMVGRSEAEILAPQRVVEATYVIVGLALTGLLGCAIVLLLGMVRRQEAIAADLRLKKAELVESRDRLRRYVADLERIAEVAAHDLQEPLRRVVSYAQLLAKHSEPTLDDEARGFVSHVVEGAQRMRTLVQELEAFVSVDHLPPATGLVQAGDALAVARARLAEQLHAAGADVTVGDLPAVAADERSLVEIFVQLLDNAVRYAAPQRRPAIRVHARVEGGMAVVAVEDNGIGIERRDLGRVFEILHRLDGLDGAGATSMGLAIARRLVERLGGRIWVDSRPGEGSTFTFSLPLQADREPASTDLEQEAKAA